ncbi:unnamed protein product [Brassica rapa]|uniref:Uncharacterized protein n=1 Tax=Brassica campestris TaxID=3711 RepID=A0A8D9CTX1_BRACM|nr:unnamed protein product [Brassica rapa]
MLALSVDCLGDFGPRGLSVQYTQDVCGCSPAHTGHPWLSVSTHRTSVAVRVCPSAHTRRPWVTHMMSVAVHQYTYQHVDPWIQHAGPSCGLFGTHRTSVGVRQHTQDVCGCLWLSVSTHSTSVDVRVCPCVSVSTHITTHRTSVGVRQHTQDVRGCPWLSVSTHRTSVAVCGCRPWVSVSTHRTSVCVRQHTQDVHGCPCVSVSIHKTSVAVHQYTYQHDVRGTLTLPMDCLGDFGPRGQSVQYTQDVRGCPPAHRVRPWLSVCVRVCLSMSVSTHRTVVALNQYTYQDVGPWTQHAGPSRGLFASFWPTWAICSVHTGCPWVSASTHRTSMAVRGCPQHTQDVCG